MSSTKAGEESPSTLAAEATELGQAHLARWLDELLPPGPCLVWAGGMTLAAVLAADRRRPVLLVEPRERAREDSARRPRPGVTSGGADAVADGMRFDSGVIVAGADAAVPLIEQLVVGALRDATVAVVVEPGQVDRVVAALEAMDRRPTAVRQHLRLASTLGADDRPASSQCLSPAEDQPSTVVVLVGVEALPSVLVGRDAGPTRAWAEVEWVRRSIRELDAELQAVDRARIDELEAQVAGAAQRLAELEARAAGLQQRIAEVEGSTSWRMTAPLRRLSDRVKRS
jgi:hypothetical protein